MSSFARACSALELGVDSLGKKLRELDSVWNANNERWLVNLGVFSLLVVISIAFVLGGGTPAHAQEAGVLGAAADYFTPGEQNFAEVYKQNLEVLNGFGCWGCNVFNAFSGSVFDVGARVGGAGQGKAFSGLIVAFACCFSLYYIGSAFVSGDASDLLSRWKGFWRLMIAVAIACSFLNAGGGAFENTWRVVYGPIMSVPLAVAKEVNGSASQGNCAVAPSSSPDLDAAKKSLEAMRGVVCDSNAIAMKGIAFGTALAMSGDGFVSAIVNAACGLVVMAIFFYITITFPMRFIDVLVRLAVVGVLTPVFIVCATFKPTRGYVQIAISNVLYCGSVFAFTSILFGLGIKFFEERMDAHIASIKDASTVSIIGSGFEIIGMAMVFASFSRTAVSLAQEFSQFRGSAGHGGDTAINLTNAIASTATKGTSAGSSLAVQKVASMRSQGVAGRAAAGGAGAVGSGSASGMLGRGISS